jgi:hypothetical protein
MHATLHRAITASFGPISKFTNDIGQIVHTAFKHCPLTSTRDADIIQRLKLLKATHEKKKHLPNNPHPTNQPIRNHFTQNKATTNNQLISTLRKTQTLLRQQTLNT